MRKLSKNLTGKNQLALVVLFSLGMTFGVSAATITYSDFSDLSAFQLNGSTATISNPATAPDSSTVLRLTDDFSQAGSAFLQTAVHLSPDASFSSEFEFQLSDPQGPWYNFEGYVGGDGFVFAATTVGNTSLGGAGGGLGYAGIGSSFGIEFDTWNSGTKDQDSGNHIGININGSVESVALVDLGSAPEEQLNEAGIWTAWVDYDGVTDLLTVRLSDTNIRPLDPILSHTVDLASVLGSHCAYFGFTSSTGSASNDHDIRSWSLDYNEHNGHVCSPVPEPSTYALIVAGAIGIGIARRRKNGKPVR